MAALRYKTNGNSHPQGKPRVYFCCHPNDFKKCFKLVSDEILAKQDCVIWYKEEPTIYDENFFADLKQMQLFVMPVTTNLLCTENDALDVEFKFAIENHIPVLPLMQESGLEELFDKRCGELQFLDKNNMDSTAISYDEKLQKYLEAVLIGDELAEKIRAAFDAYVFLSYRKKDRRYAQELMRLIHKNDFCRDIAIWYDEFLTPGENFNDSIKEALQKSGLFVLTVTPNLLEEPNGLPNFVMGKEYPMAREEGKPVLPAELVPTDRDKLAEKYADIPKPANAYNDLELSEALLDSIKKMNIKDNDVSPEHNLFIGLAYLDGIDVEVDYERALELILMSAQSGLMQAMDKLVEMYRFGKGVARDYNQAIVWQRNKIERMLLAVESNFEISERLKVFEEVVLLGDYYKEVSNYPKAEEAYKQAMDFVKSFSLTSNDDRIQAKTCICETMGKLGDLSLQQDKLNDAKHWCKHCVWGYEEAFNEIHDERFIQKIAYGYMRLGDVFYIMADYKNARTCYVRCHESALSLCQKTGSGVTLQTGEVFARRLIAKSYRRLGDLALENGDYSGAETYYMQSIGFANNLYSETNSIEILNDLIASNGALSEVKLLQKCSLLPAAFSNKSLEYAEKIFEETGTYASTITLVECYCQYARCLSADKLYKKAISILEKAQFKIDSLLNAVESAKVKVLQAYVYECSSEIYRLEENDELAINYLKKAYTIYQESGLWEHPEHYAEAYARIYCNKGILLGRTYFFDALKMYDIIVTSHIERNIPTTKRLFMKIVDIVKNNFGEDVDITPVIKDATAPTIVESLLKNSLKENTDYVTNKFYMVRDYSGAISRIYIMVAEAYLKRAGFSTAKFFLMEATKIKEKLSKKDKKVASKRELAELYLKTADVCEKVGNCSDSKKYKEKGLAILATLPAN